MRILQQMLTTTMDVPKDVLKELEQPEQAKQFADSQNLHAKLKDPKKQEAGRKGAAARRQKLEALKAELAATKEMVFRENNEEHAVDTKASKTHVSSEPKTTMPPQGSSGGRSEGTGPGWGVGIGLAVAAGVVLFAVRPFARQFAQMRVVSFKGAKSLVPAPVHHSCAEPSMFDME